MEMEVWLEGAVESLEKQAQIVEAKNRLLEETFEYILRLMVTHAKKFGPYKDRTGALRNSISVNIDNMRLMKTGEKPDGKLNEKPVIEVSGDSWRGVLSAGMEYAIYVEWMDGYWVLQGTIDQFQPHLTRMFSSHLQVGKLAYKAKHPGSLSRR